METDRLRAMLENIQSGRLSIDNALDELKYLPYEQLGDFANLDHHRTLRSGFPEVIFAEGKTPEQVFEIFQRLMQRGPLVMATRVSTVMYEAIGSRLAGGVYNPTARILYYRQETNPKLLPGVLVLTAGTSDIPVAEEAALTAELLGNQVERIFDVGVAGLHRLIHRLPAIQKARVIIVVAGMEGALPSVVGGLTAAPVIAVPTSVGYGAAFHGLSALLGMLNSCASGVGVMNIDNGFGAACLAARINRLDAGSPA